MSASATEQVVRLSGRISDRLYSWGVSVGGFLLLTLILVLFQSIFWAAHVPLALKLGIAALGVLSVFRPADGLLVVAGLAPLGYMLTTRVFAAYPARITEAIVLALFAGYALRIALTRLPRRPGGTGTDLRTSDADSRPLGPPSNLLTPALLFCAIVVASCVVHYHIVQAWHDHPWPFFQRFLDFLVWGYHDAIGNIDPTAKLAGFGFVVTTAFVLEGTALFLSAFTFCARDPGLRGRLVTMVVAGAVGASVLSFVRLAMAMVGEVDPIASLPGLLALRWTMFTPKLNTAASLFVLVAPLALAAAAARTGRRSGWVAAASVIVAALWINGTRVAIIAAILVLLAAFAWFVRQHRRRVTEPAMVVGLLVLSAGLVGTAYQHLYVEKADALSALRLRAMFTETSVRMFASRPIFGVGIGQYFLLAEQFAPEELPPYYRRVQAHNPFLQTAAELGVFGLVAFTWLIGAAFWLVARALRERPHDAYLVGALAGVTAFLLTTASSGHPLLLEVTAYPFWIVLGLAAAEGFRGQPAVDPIALDDQPQEERTPATGVVRGWGTWGTVLGVSLILISLPVRRDREVRKIDFAQVTYGLHDWETAAGARYRWTTGRVTLFVDASTTFIELPLRAPLIETTGPMHIEVFLDGRLASRLELSRPEWHPLQMMIPPSDRPYRALELNITPTWIPAALLPGSTGTRELGVMVGEMRREAIG